MELQTPSGLPTPRLPSGEATLQCREPQEMKLSAQGNKTMPEVIHLHMCGYLHRYLEENQQVN